MPLTAEDRDALWNQLAAALQADEADERPWTSEEIAVEQGPWRVTLDTFTVVGRHSGETFVRLKAEYPNPSGFRVSISHKGLLSKLAVWLGMQDIQIGDERFDDEFVIQGTDADRVRGLFADAAIREAIWAQRGLTLAVKHLGSWFGGGKGKPEAAEESANLSKSAILKRRSELYLQAPCETRDLATLQELFNLFGRVLAYLTSVDSPPS